MIDPDLDPIFDLSQSRANRDAGMAEVTREAFMASFLDFVLGLPLSWRGIGEDIRRMSGLKAHHPNAWGAAVNVAFKRGLLEKTGRYLPMTDTKSNSRMSPEYHRIGT